MTQVRIPAPVASDLVRANTLPVIVHAIMPAIMHAIATTKKRSASDAIDEVGTGHCDDHVPDLKDTVDESDVFLRVDADGPKDWGDVVRLETCKHGSEMMFGKVTYHQAVS